MDPSHNWVAHYEEGVPPTVNIPEMPLHQMLSESARQYGSNIALRMVLKYLPLGLAIQSKFSYRELDEMVNRMARALHELGVRKGDRVALMLPNTPQTVISYYGILRAGGIVVNINPTYTPREMQHQLADSGARTIVLLSPYYERLTQIRERTGIEQILITDVAETLSWPFRGLVEKQLRASGMMKDVPQTSGVNRMIPLLRQHPPQPPQIEIESDDTILLQYTGGTTGVPKAAELSNGNLVSNVLQMEAWFTTTEYGNEKLLGALPFFHVYGMTVGMLLSVRFGAELVIVPDPRQTTHILDVIQRERISLYPGVPAMYTAIINYKDVQQYNLRSVKACLSGGAALPVEVAKRFEELTGGRLVEGYGLTETSPVACANPIYGERRSGSIGVPVPNTRVEVVSLEPQEDGSYKHLEVGEEGEVVIYGPQVMKGYWNTLEETAKTIDADGGLHTGDIGKRDEDGYFYIVDRKKDLIIASGYNVVPREVEEVLFMHPKIMEAAVAGIPDPKRGETVKAYVVLKPGESATVDEIRSFCKENLAPYKVPTAVDFRTELPKTQVGKVLRRELVKEEIAKMKAAQEEGVAAGAKEN